MHHAHIDKFAYKDSPVHRLDSRVKFAALIVFTVCVISLPRKSVSILACYAVGPFALLVLGEIPLKFVIKQILLVSPFILVLALSCPFYDRTASHVNFGPFSYEITVGWLRCFTVLGKFTVTMAALIGLVSTTRFNDLLAGLQRMGMPRLLTIQLGFLYRYIFVLIDKAHHILRARNCRKLRNLGFKAELKTAAAMVGSLLLRSIDTAQNINIAMEGRGFNGSWRTVNRLRICLVDIIFACIVAVFLLILHFFVRPLL